MNKVSKIESSRIVLLSSVRQNIDLFAVFPTYSYNKFAIKRSSQLCMGIIATTVYSTDAKSRIPVVLTGYLSLKNSYRPLTFLILNHQRNRI